PCEREDAQNGALSALRQGYTYLSRMEHHSILGMQLPGRRWNDQPVPTITYFPLLQTTHVTGLPEALSATILLASPSRFVTPFFLRSPSICCSVGGLSVGAGLLSSCTCADAFADVNFMAAKATAVSAICFKIPRLDLPSSSSAIDSVTGISTSLSSISAMCLLL